MESTTLNTNSLAFIALCNEYCMAIENARESSRDEFVASMLRLLPRIYIAATDLRVSTLTDDEDAYLESALDEDYYESVRRSVENLMGADDMYLEVFEDDMKYSDTPIAASVSEALADLFQVMYNFVETIKDAPQSKIEVALVAIKDDFINYWSRLLCNVMRPLNHLGYIADEDEY
ncbi:MAG: DUF5063 domain-containing protein [Bacteroidales bacterium]|nr:DUF5063 domain-containing protein [Bacteroidales bacterium]